MTEPATDEQRARWVGGDDAQRRQAWVNRIRAMDARIEAEKERADAAEKRYELAHGDWLKAIERIAELERELRDYKESSPTLVEGNRMKERRIAALEQELDEWREVCQSDCALALQVRKGGSDGQEHAG